MSSNAVNWELAGVGIGPGDPGLISLKGCRILESADLVIAPAARSGQDSLAARIIRQAGIKPKQLVELEFPMSRDRAVLSAAWREAAKPALEYLEQERCVAFCTLGDPSLYSTWQYFRRAVLHSRPDTRVLTVPGIMAFGAAAAALQLPLAEQEQNFALIPLPAAVKDLSLYLPLFDRLVIYKIGSRLEELRSWLDSQAPGLPSYLACAVGQKERERLGLLADLADQGADGYLSLAIVENPNRGNKL